MSEEEKKPDGEGGEEAPKTDAFGQPEKEPAPPKSEAGGGDKGGDGKGGGTGDDKKFDAIPEDHPTIVALKNQIEAVKTEYSGNLAGQREVITSLEKKIEELGKGKGGEEGKDDEDVLFKDIKTSKDLTDEQREEMTETEIKQMDEIAAMKVAQNKMYAEMMKKGKEDTETTEQNVNQIVQDTAKELAKASAGKDDTELANQIIESFKSMKFDLTGLKEEDIKSRVATAAKEISTYKPPKEQKGKKGGAVKAGTEGGETDPFGKNDEIVDSLGKENDGNYQL